MSTATLCIGATVADKEEQVAKACRFVATLGTVVADSGCFPTPPEGCPAGTEPYANRVVVLRTGLEHSRLRALTKEYQDRCREASGEAGVAIDIDIVVFDDLVLRPADAASGYFRAGMAALRQI